MIYMSFPISTGLPYFIAIPADTVPTSGIMIKIDHEFINNNNEINCNFANCGNTDCPIVANIQQSFNFQFLFEILTKVFLQVDVLLV